MFQGLGKLQDNYHIKFKTDAQPYALTTTRRVAKPLMPKVKAELPYFLECFSPSNCIRPLIVFAQLSGLNVYCFRPRIVLAPYSKRCARAIVIRKDNSLLGLGLR